MDEETGEALLELSARCDGLTIMVGALAAMLVQHRILPDAEFTTPLLQAEAHQRMHNEHQASIDTLRIVREMVDEAIAARDAGAGSPASRPRE